jgi:hypothetical protein
MIPFVKAMAVRHWRSHMSLARHHRSKQGTRLRPLIAVAAAVVYTQIANAAPLDVTVTVHAIRHSYHNIPVIADIEAAGFPPGITAANLVSTDHKERLVCQISRDHDDVHLVFVVPDLPQGTTKTYRLMPRRAIKGHGSAVIVSPRGGDLDVFIRSGTERRLFTTYTTHSGPNKPFFYPILTPEGNPMTRRWPLEQNTGESHDHIHHRGLWFTHSSVNGIDFWTEQGKVGKTVTTGYANVVSGPVYGGFRATTAWRSPEDKLVATDTRDVRIIPLPGGDRLLDFTITITPAGEPLTFGDNKDGVFGLRLPDTLAPHPDTSAHIATPTGHILNDMGQKDGEAWGKPAHWVDYWGPIAGQTYGVAMFDGLTNFRHPQTWHARDYGLFTVNPFGLHDFHLGNKGAGDYIVPADKTLTLHYAVLFHHGDAEVANVANRYMDWAEPPEIGIIEQ